jgi:hypothetical protein
MAGKIIGFKFIDFAALGSVSVPSDIIVFAAGAIWFFSHGSIIARKKKGASKSAFSYQDILQIKFKS